MGASMDIIDKIRPLHFAILIAIAALLAVTAYVIMPFVNPVHMAGHRYLEKTGSQVESIAACIQSNWKNLDQFLPLESAIAARNIPHVDEYDIHLGVDTYGRPLVAYRVSGSSPDGDVSIIEVVGIGSSWPMISSDNTSVVWKIDYDTRKNTFAISEPITSIGHYDKATYLYAICVAAFIVGWIACGHVLYFVMRVLPNKIWIILIVIYGMLPLVAAAACMFACWPTWRPHAHSATMSEILFVLLLFISLIVLAVFFWQFRSPWHRSQSNPSPDPDKARVFDEIPISVCDTDR